MFDHRARGASTSAAAIALLLCGSAAATAVQVECRGASWSWFGADVLHCPGGRCEYEPATEDGDASYRLSAEPWLRAIAPSDPSEPAVQLLEGDVLVAVDGFLITTPRGGSALANLEPGRVARLTVRRADRLMEIDVTPQERCGEPLMLVGNSLLERQQDRERAAGPSDSDRFELRAESGPDGEERVLDFTRPFRTGATALDMSLGLVLRCTACSLDARAKRWEIQDYPTVSKVVPGGVADEAGLRVGDQIRSIAGRDLRSRRGGQLLFEPPRGDFGLAYQRQGRSGKALINRHVVDQRIRQVVDRRVVRIERGKDGWDPEILGALTRAWSGLQRQALEGIEELAQVGSRRWLVSGDRWGLPAWGLLFEAPDGRFFTVSGSGDDERIRLLSEPRVAEVEPGGPAERVGLEVGDVLVEIDGHPILGNNGTRRLLLGDPEKSVSLHVRRGTRVTRVNLQPEIEP